MLQRECPSLQQLPLLAGQRWGGGAEAWNEGVFQARARRVVQQLLNSHVEGDVVALITHHDFAAYLLAELVGGEPLIHVTWRFSLSNTSLTWLKWHEQGGWELWGLNVRPHLQLIPGEQ